MNQIQINQTNEQKQLITMNTAQAKALYKAFNVLYNTPGMSEMDFLRAMECCVAEKVEQVAEPVAMAVVKPVVKPVTEKVVQRIVKAPKKVAEKKLKKSKIPMPWTGIVNVSCCYALRYNLGLYTQCTRKQDSDRLCTKCLESIENNNTGKLPHGHVDERLALKEKWRSQMVKHQYLLFKFGNKKN